MYVFYMDPNIKNFNCVLFKKNTIGYIITVILFVVVDEAWLSG